jgi:hypothetical protein
LINDVVVTGATIGAIEPETETKSPAFFLEYSRYRSEKTRLTLHLNMTRFETDYLVRSSGEALGTISDDLALDVAAGIGHKGLFSFGAGMRF